MTAHRNDAAAWIDGATCAINGGDFVRDNPYVSKAKRLSWARGWCEAKVCVRADVRYNPDTDALDSYETGACFVGTDDDLYGDDDYKALEAFDRRMKYYQSRARRAKA